MYVGKVQGVCLCLPPSPNGSFRWPRCKALRGTCFPALTCAAPAPHVFLPQVKLQGIEGIRKVFLREAKRTRLDPHSGGFVTDNEWVLDTEGE